METLLTVLAHDTLYKWSLNLNGVSV